jgi:hypothetical protein
VLGLLKEVLVDHRIAGEVLEDNIVVVAACNPPRSQIATKVREHDLGKEWASGHYQVAKLPASLNKLKWSFGSLTRDQEKEFIYRRIEALHRGSMSPFLRASLTEHIAASHEAMRQFAERNILVTLRKSNEEEKNVENREADACARAKSVVSLRDIQRVFSLYEFFSSDGSKDIVGNGFPVNRECRAMLLATATVYYLRLDSESRKELLNLLDKLPTASGQSCGLLPVLEDAMNAVMNGTEIPPGIAVTRGLKENMFVTLVCSLSRTPLMIVGPPGSSKVS